MPRRRNQGAFKRSGAGSTRSTPETNLGHLNAKKIVRARAASRADNRSLERRQNSICWNIDCGWRGVSPASYFLTTTTRGRKMKTELATRLRVEADAAKAFETLQRREADMAKMEKHTREISRVESMPLYSTVKNFRGPDAELKAYQFGMWALGVLGNDTTRFISNFTKRAIAYCENWGLNTKAQGEAVDTGGGYLVPTYFLNDLIQLREEFGVFRRTTQVVPMTSEVMIVPRRAGGLTVYYPAEGIATTESQKIWDGVSLTARKYACLILYSSELNEDAIVSVGDDLAGELAYAFAVAEDNNAFNGDGTSTFAGTNGVR